MKELQTGIWQNKDLAEWFGIKITSFSSQKRKKLEELKQYACFNENKDGSIEIWFVKEPIHCKNMDLARRIALTVYCKYIEKLGEDIYKDDFKVYDLSPVIKYGYDCYKEYIEQEMDRKLFIEYLRRERAVHWGPYSIGLEGKRIETYEDCKMIRDIIKDRYEAGYISLLEKEVATMTLEDIIFNKFHDEASENNDAAIANVTLRKLYDDGILVDEDNW